MVLADRADRKGEAVFKRFKVNATPTVLFVDGDGAEVDWHVGYGPPPEKFHVKVDNTAKGIDTFKSLSGLYAKDPKTIEVVYKLAEKFDNRYVQDKAKALYREVVALDPDGKLGMTETWDGEKVSFTESAEFSLGQMAVFDWGKRDAAPLKAFIAKYPQSKLLENAYSYLGYFYINETKDKAVPFFEEYVAKFPDKPYALSAYVDFLIRAKTDIDRGIELAKKIEKLTAYNTLPRFAKNMAELYILKEDKAKAGEAYAKKNWDQPSSLSTYARFWANQGMNLESALAAANRANEQTPSAYVWDIVAAVYLKMKKYDEATKAAQEAIKLAGDQADYFKQRLERIKKAQDEEKKAAEKK